MSWQYNQQNQGNYPPQQQGQYPPQNQYGQGYPSSGSYPPQQNQQFPPQNQGNYPQQGAYNNQAPYNAPGQYPQQQGQFPPSQSTGSQYPPQQNSYGHQQGGYNQPGQPFTGQYGNPGATQGQPGQQQPGQPMPGQVPGQPPLTAQEEAQMRAWFRRVESDRSGFADVYSLGSLEYAAVTFATKTVRRLLRLFDRNNDGKIDFNEYVQLHKFVAASHGAYYTYDKDKSDSLEFAEVEQAIKTEQRLNFGPTMIQAVFKKFSKGETSITFEQYLQIVTFLTNLKKQFEVTDTDMDGRITVTLDQLVEIVAKI
jgi:Ca2+-binding EF-hand superfamily protein